MIVGINSADEANAESTRGINLVGKFDPFRPAPYLVEDPPDALGMDEVFSTLANQRRRFAILSLSRTDGPISSRELAEQITAWECGKDVEQISPKERKNVSVSMAHCHLPKLADISAISSDPDSGDIDTGERFDIFAHYLRD